MYLVGVGQVDARYALVVETEGASTMFAIEVGMMVVEGIVVVTHANLVFEGSAAVLYGVHQVVAHQERESTEYGASLGRDERVLDVAQTLRAAGLREGAEHQCAHGRGFDAALYEMLFDIHVSFCLGQWLAVNGQQS